MKKRIVRKKAITKTELQATIKEQSDKLEWANKIIRLQQAEVDRLMRLTETLTETLNQFSKRN